MGQTRFNNRFDDFRQKRKVGDRTVIGFPHLDDRSAMLTQEQYQRHCAGAA